MTVTTSQIRDLLNRPRGLNEGTISEYITMRTAEVNKKARSSSLYGLSDEVGNDDTVKESAIKMLVACDCLRVMIDTIPSYVAESERKEQDIRLGTQLRQFEKRADEMLALVSEKGGTVYQGKVTKTKLSE